MKRQPNIDSDPGRSLVEDQGYDPENKDLRVLEAIPMPPSLGKETRDNVR